MKKPIKSSSVQRIPSDWIPYKNSRGNWVWRRADIPEDRRWPGHKAPEWAKSVIFENGLWCWTD